MDVILQQLRIVVRHLFEVRDNPALVNRVTVKASAKLVIHSTLRHFGQRRCNNCSHTFLAGPAYQSSSKSMAEECGNLGAPPKAAILVIEDSDTRLHHHAHDARREVCVASGEPFGIGEHVHGLVG